MLWVLCGGDWHAKAWRGAHRPFPYVLARRCRWRTLPCQSAAPAGAAVAMSLNLNGSSFPFPFSAASRLHFRGDDMSYNPLGGVSREKVGKLFCIPRPAKIGGGAPLPSVLKDPRNTVLCLGSHFRRQIQGRRPGFRKREAWDLDGDGEADKNTVWVGLWARRMVPTGIWVGGGSCREGSHRMVT